jgi:hypothetical protein
MTQPKTFYGFDYDKTTETMLWLFPQLIDNIQFAVDRLMNAHGEDFVGDDEIEAVGAKLPHFENRERWKQAYMEITRQLIGLLFDCLPPILDEARGEYFILPDEMTNDHAREHFERIAESGHDAKERINQEFWESIKGLSLSPDEYMERFKAFIAEQKAKRDKEDES